MKSLLIICVTVLFYQTTFAQYGYPRQRRNTGFAQPQSQRSVPLEKVKRDPAVIAAERMPTYADVLKLDAFQQEILKGMLLEHYDKYETVRIDASIKFADRQDAFIKLEDELHQKLATIFTEDQIEAFKKVQFLDEKEKKKKKKRKKKKSKKNKDKTKEGAY